MDLFELNYDGVRKNSKYEDLVNKTITKCFEVEKLLDKDLYVNVVLTTPEKIQKLNKEFRKKDKSTDVLSFPMFEKGKVKRYKSSGFPEPLGDIVINVEQVKIQAKEYENTFEREFCYMLVHSFYHLMGEDHMIEEEKEHMRKKEENVLGKLGIVRK
jgi:probable rRNA maturation factor